MTRYKKKKLSRKQLLHIFVFSIFCVLGLTVVYVALSTTLPSDTIEISNLGVDYNFIQADMSVCS